MKESIQFSRRVFCDGIRDGFPIALGYFAVSFSLGIAARNAGLTPMQGFWASLLNNASAGEYAAFTLIAALGRVGVQTASVIAVLGAAGLAIGLALQGSLSNLAAGVLLVTFRPFRSGEYVDLGGIAGTVLQVQIFSTTLRTVDGRIVVVPNGKIIAGNIINFSREPARRNELIISVAYDSDIDQVKSLISNIIASDDRILKDKEQTVRLNELGASSINFVVRIWSKSSDLQNVYWDVLERIKRDFDANGISFPYPQMDVNVKKVKEAE